MEHKTILGLSVRLAKHGPAPAWTDNGVIFILDVLNDSERRCALRHELGHIMLLHQQKAVKNKWDPTLANIAGDAEIALTLYDDDDEKVMGRAGSLLRSGITKKWAHDHAPGCSTIEEIYEHLKKHAITVHSSCGHVHDQQKDKSTTGKPFSPEEIQAKLQELERDLNKQSQKHRLHQAPKQRRQKGFHDVIADIAREAIIRSRTYRRPSRRHPSTDLLRKGVRTRKTRPKISVYVDRSGSFTPDKTAMAEQEMQSIAHRYAANLRVDFLFFSDAISYNSAEIQGGGTNYVDVAKHIIATQPRVAVVITDDDHCDTLPQIPSTVQVFAKLINCSSSDFASKVRAKII